MKRSTFDFLPDISGQLDVASVKRRLGAYSQRSGEERGDTSGRLLKCASAPGEITSPDQNNQNLPRCLLWAQNAAPVCSEEYRDQGVMASNCHSPSQQYAKLLSSLLADSDGGNENGLAVYFGRLSEVNPLFSFVDGDGADAPTCGSG